MKRLLYLVQILTTDSIPVVDGLGHTSGGGGLELLLALRIEGLSCPLHQHPAVVTFHPLGQTETKFQRLACRQRRNYDIGESRADLARSGRFRARRLFPEE